jgi:uncharacterized membrane protein
MIQILNIFIAFLLVLLSTINVFIVKRKTKEIPLMWLSLLVGFVFIFLSQIIGYFGEIYKQPAYFLQYYKEIVGIVGVVFILRYLLLYLGKSK